MLVSNPRKAAVNLPGGKSILPGGEAELTADELKNLGVKQMLEQGYLTPVKVPEKPKAKRTFVKNAD